MILIKKYNLNLILLNKFKKKAELFIIIIL